MIKRIMRGITVSPETLAEEVICEVGPGGQYLTHEHTLKHFKTEFWVPELMSRDNISLWESKGKPQLADNLNNEGQVHFEGASWIPSSQGCP